MTALADWLHERDMKLGLYTDRGTQTCQGRMGSRHYEALDAATFATWGVDFVKEDSCFAYADQTSAVNEYSLMRDGLNATGRPIFFSLCGWAPWYGPIGAALSNSARIGGDGSFWKDVLANLDNMAPLAAYAGPGFWLDPDMLVGLRTQDGQVQLTELQMRAQFTLWSLLCAPLLIGSSLFKASSYTLATYTNREVIALNQEHLTQALRISGGDVHGCATGSLSGAQCATVWGKATGPRAWTVALFNAGSQPFNVTCDAGCFRGLNLTESDLPLQAKDLWGAAAMPTLTSLALVAELPASGGVLLARLTAA